MKLQHFAKILSVFLPLTSSVVETMGQAVKNNVKVQRESIDLDNSKSVQVQLLLGVGFLTVKGGSKKLVDATFSYNEEKWKPTFSYNLKNTVGILKIVQSTDSSIKFEEHHKNNWDIQFNQDKEYDISCEIPTGSGKLDLRGFKIKALQISSGTGEVDLNLADTSIPKINVKTGVGLVKVDLSGEWKNDLNAQIESGVGGVSLTLPKNTAVKVKINGLVTVNAQGLKKVGESYVNDAYKNAAHTLNIVISGGLGSVNLVMAD